MILCQCLLDMARNCMGCVWNSFSDLTNALLELAHAPNVIQEQCLHTIERFVILVYDRTSTSTEVNRARKKLFAKTSSVQKIPPTYSAQSGATCEASNLPRWSCLGGKHFVQILYFLHQIVRGGPRPWWSIQTILDYT